MSLRNGLEKWLVSLRNGLEKWLVSLRNGFEKWLVSLRNGFGKWLRRLTNHFSRPLRRLTNHFSRTFTLNFWTKSSNLKVKGVDIEFFTLIIVFRRVISFIYQKCYLSDRVPLRLCCIEVRIGWSFHNWEPLLVLYFLWLVFDLEGGGNMDNFKIRWI